jgi:cellulose synthase operon protein C
VLAAALDDASVHAQVGPEWVRLCAAANDWSCGKRLREWMARGDIGRRSMHAYIEALANKQQKSRLRRFVRKNRQWLRKDTAAWGWVAYAGAHLFWYRFVAKWVADWRDRPDAEAWMLVNAAEGFRALGRDEEAREVSRHALALPPSHGQDLHRVWLAADAAAAGDTRTVRELLGQANHQELNAGFAFLKTLAEAAAEMAEAPRQQRRSVFRAVLKRIDRARAGYKAFPKEAAYRRMYRRCLQRVARYRGGLLAAISCGLRCLASY